MELTVTPDPASDSPACFEAAITPAFADMYAMFPTVLPPVDGRDVDNAAPALLLHVRQHEARQFVTVEQIEIEDGAVVFEGSLREVGSAHRSPGVVHENIDGAESFDRIAVEARQVVDLGNVGDNSNGPDPKPGQFINGSVYGALGASAYRDIDAFTAQ